jgi:hypothetical protein
MLTGSVTVGKTYLISLLRSQFPCLHHRNDKVCFPEFPWGDAWIKPNTKNGQSVSISLWKEPQVPASGSCDPPHPSSPLGPNEAQNKHIAPPQRVFPCSAPVPHQEWGTKSSLWPFPPSPHIGPDVCISSFGKSGFRLQPSALALELQPIPKDMNQGVPGTQGPNRPSLSLMAALPMTVSISECQPEAQGDSS